MNLALIKDIYFVLYGMFSLRVLNKYQKVSKQNYAVEIEHNLKWLYTFLICFVGVIVIDLILTISEITLGYIVLWDGYITVFALICSISYLGYCGLKQAVIDLPDFLVKKNNYKSDKKKIRILNPEQKKELEGLKLELEKVMNEKKPYLSQDITLQKLADSINISERKLSLLLSDTMKTSFYNLINKYRVEDVKKKLHSTEYSEYSLEGIGYSSGFNSKSSFYRIFKKETQLSPLQFKQKLS
ncbi:helix-turn-helix domain-containing protein [Croceitalea sp. MTPC5]|uniref:helix-turn-helix domain-containing protein n=1 Tax=Croceitalea sp. MTPC5 TaxID=3056565 RepID=UPI0030CBD44D